MTFRISARAYRVHPYTHIPMHTDTHTHAYDSYYLHVLRSCFIDRESWFGKLCEETRRGRGCIEKKRILMGRL